MTTLRTRRTYDHRIRETICETGDPGLFPELKIPRSTIRSWFHRCIPDVVTCDLLSAERTELLAEMQELRHRAEVLGAIVGLLVAILRVSKQRLDHERLPEGNGKRALLRAIERASKVVPRRRHVAYARQTLISVRCSCSGRSVECLEMQQPEESRALSNTNEAGFVSGLPVQLIRNQQVGGSNPLPATTESRGCGPSCLPRGPFGSGLTATRQQPGPGPLGGVGRRR